MLANKIKTKKLLTKLSCDQRVSRRDLSMVGNCNAGTRAYCYCCEFYPRMLSAATASSLSLPPTVPFLSPPRPPVRPLVDVRKSASPKPDETKLPHCSLSPQVKVFLPD